MAKYLVTGGSGFIGSALCRRLKEKGHEVVSVDDWSTNGVEWSVWYTKYGKADFQYNLDLEDPDNVDSIFRSELSKKSQRFDAVFHVAAKPRVQFSVAHPVESHMANVNATLNILDACRRYSINRMVYSASSSAYGDQDTLPLKESMHPNPLSPYALQKYMGEEYCRMYSELYGLECISLRYFNVYGPYQNPTGGYPALIPKFADAYFENQQPTIYGDGNQTRDFTFVGDVVEANVLAAKCQNDKAFGQVFNIGNGKNVSVKEVAALIAKISESDIEPKHGPSVVESRHTLADNSKAREILGWSPKMNFETGLQVSVRSIRETQHVTARAKKRDN